MVNIEGGAVNCKLCPPLALNQKYWTAPLENLTSLSLYHLLLLILGRGRLESGQSEVISIRTVLATSTWGNYVGVIMYNFLSEENNLREQVLCKL